jgi:uncharacterized protein
MKILVHHGFSVHTTDSAGHTALMVAVIAGQKAAAEWLMQQGTAVTASSYCGTTALHLASGSTSVDDAAMIELLLANGADVHQWADARITALDGAVHVGNVQCARVLIAAGANVNTINLKGSNYLHTAVERQHPAVVQLLLEHCATAVINSVVPILCPNGDDCCTRATALMLCNEAGTAKLLLAAGADVHVTNDVGDTCLHAAARHNYKAPVLCLLIKAGADLDEVNNEGKTAAQLAHDKGNILIEQLLNRAAQQEH